MVHQPGEPAAAFSCEPDRDGAGRPRRSQSTNHVLAVPGRRDANRDVTGTAQAPRPDARTDRRSRSRCRSPSAPMCRSSTQSRPSAADCRSRGCSGRRAQWRCAERPPRRRRCRRGAACARSAAPAHTPRRAAETPSAIASRVRAATAACSAISASRCSAAFTLVEMSLRNSLTASARGAPCGPRARKRRPDSMSPSRRWPSRPAADDSRG